MTALEGNGLTKRYGEREVVRQVDIAVRPGEVVGLLGPNGAGKTTTFNMVAGGVKPSEGRIRLGETDITSLPMYRRKGDYRTNPEAADAYLDRFVGRDRRELERRSPAYNVTGLEAGLLIIHGENDVRVPIEQARFLRGQLENAGIPFEWLVRDEGHGFTRPENRQSQYQAMLGFLHRHIGSPSP